MTIKPESLKIDKRRSLKIYNHDWNTIQQTHNKGKNLKETRELYNLTYSELETAIRNNLFYKNKEVINQSQREKSKQQMINFWKSTPEIGRKRLIRSQNSASCRNVKQYLKDNNINFVEEHNPNVPDRYFHIDIALPDKMIGIEINGMYHYKDKQNRIFTDYHIERKRLIEDLGWKIIDIDSTLCYSFKKEYWIQLITDLLSSQKLLDFDYLNVPIKNKGVYCSCGKKINPHKKKDRIHYCVNCAMLKRRKHINLEKSEVQKLYNELGLIKLAKHLNISSSCLNKKLHEYNIERKRNKQLSISKEKLKKLSNTKSVSQIAKQFNVSADVMRRIFDENNIPTNKPEVRRKYIYPSKEQFEKMLENNTPSQISKLLDIKLGTIYYLIKKYHLKLNISSIVDKLIL